MEHSREPPTSSLLTTATLRSEDQVARKPMHLHSVLQNTFTVPAKTGTPLLSINPASHSQSRSSQGRQPKRAALGPFLPKNNNKKRRPAAWPIFACGIPFKQKTRTPMENRMILFRGNEENSLQGLNLYVFRVPLSMNWD